jgi:hypothetical protein
LRIPRNKANGFVYVSSTVGNNALTGGKKKARSLRTLTVLLLAMLCLVSVSALVIPSQAAATTLRLHPIRGIIGSSVAITGVGYPTNSMVTFSGLFTQSCSTNSTGGISNCTETVPNVPAGSYVVFSSSGGVGTSAKFTVSSRAHITIKPISGLPGSTVTVTGTHFGWNSKLTVSFNGAKVTTTPSTATTSSTGTFTLTFIVPSDAPKSYIVTVKDALSYTANTVYTVT